MQLKNFILLTILTLLPALPDALAKEEESEIGLLDSLSERINFSALLKLETAFGIKDGEFQKFMFTIEPELEVDLPYDHKLTAIGRARFDAFDKLGFGDPSQPELSDLTKRYIKADRLEIELRELYVDGDLGRVLYRLGKQQIVWGKADGLKVLDVVNPQSFREFILEPFDVSRIPLWSASIEVPIGEVVAQLIWIPDRSYNVLPEQGFLFAFTSPKFVPEAPPGVNVDLQSPKRPTRFISDSDAGVRLSTFWKGWDLTLNYLYHYDDFPVLFQEFSITPKGPLVTIKPRYRRTHLIGGTFSNAFGDFTIRGEIAFNIDKFFITDDPDDNDGVEEGDELNYVLGIDWFGITDTLVSFQLFQTFIINTERPITENKFDNIITLLIEREFMNETLELGVLYLQSINDGDGLIRARIEYEFTDNIVINAGLDIFYGDIDGLFGEFRGNDRMVVGIEYGI